MQWLHVHLQGGEKMLGVIYRGKLWVHPLRQSKETHFLENFQNFAGSD